MQPSVSLQDSATLVAHSGLRTSAACHSSVASGLVFVTSAEASGLVFVTSAVASGLVCN